MACGAVTAEAALTAAIPQAIPEVPAVPAMLPQHLAELFPVGRLETGELEETRAPLALPAPPAGQRSKRSATPVRRPMAQAAVEGVVVRLVVRAVPAAMVPEALAVPAAAPALVAAVSAAGTIMPRSFLEEAAEGAVERATAPVSRDPPAIPEVPALLLTTQKQ